VAEIRPAQVGLGEVGAPQVHHPEIRVLEVHGLLGGELVEVVDLVLAQQRDRGGFTNQRHGYTLPGV